MKSRATPLTWRLSPNAALLNKLSGETSGESILYCHRNSFPLVPFSFLPRACCCPVAFLCALSFLFSFFLPSSPLCCSGSWRQAKLNKGLAAQALLNNFGWSGLFLWHAGAGSTEPAGTGKKTHSQRSVCTCLSFMCASPWEPCRSEPNERWSKSIKERCYQSFCVNSWEPNFPLHALMYVIPSLAVFFGHEMLSLICDICDFPDTEASS